MGNRVRTALLALVVGVLSAVATAQATLGVPEVLTGGQDAPVTYSDPARAGEAVTVTVDNGSVVNPQSEELVVHLDEDGNGSVMWRVPLTWDCARFNAPGVEELSRSIGLPPIPQLAEL
jgi:hypothetical protein